ncbi:MAG: hypothetical protein QOF11_2527 [Chloroflexota bacterium]|nr:hypothetical protein [Chloroflexota bacterium]
MTASEFAFLALGLVLGVASGAALSIVIRARPPAPREVRVTVATDAVPRRAATLSGMVVPEAPSASAAARGGPADPMVLGTGAAVRTPVHSDLPRPLVGVPIRPEPDGLVEALEGTMTVAVLDRAPATVGAAHDPGHHDHAVQAMGGDGPASLAPPAIRADAGRTTAAAAVTRSALGDGVASPTVGPDACADERRQADERCALADRLGEAASAAADRVHQAQRAYDEHTGRAARAAVVADARATRAAKESAWAQFRQSNVTGGTRDDVEGAARDWLQEIDRINRTAHDAELEAIREREAAGAVVVLIERLSVEADAARVNAETASEACVVARSALAACEGAEVEPRRGPPEEPTDGPDEGLPRARLVGGTGLGPNGPLLDEEATQRVFGGHEPAILKLLRGDRETTMRIVTSLAGEDPSERRQWQLALGSLVDAILARAIEASALEFPRSHPFWSAFSQAQCRDVATALASFGYRFDGLGGFVDGRIPSQRDLSLAVGYAGFDPMRFRSWPNEHDAAELYRDVAVSAGEFLAGAAGGLTLGEMLAVLHGRAEGLTALWNAWGRVRPLLLQP